MCFLIVLLEDYIAAGNVIKAVGQAEGLFNQRGPFHAEDKAIRDLAETILERVEAIPETRSENAESNWTYFMGNPYPMDLYEVFYGDGKNHGISLDEMLRSMQTGTLTMSENYAVDNGSNESKKE